MIESNSAQTSQFTFGATPDSKLSDQAYSGSNSMNKSFTKEKDMIYSTREVIKQSKIKPKKRKSSISEKHRRSNSKASKKGKKSSK